MTEPTPYSGSLKPLPSSAPVGERREGGQGELNLLQQFAGAFLRDVNLGILLLDTQFRLVDISEMACNVLGWEREQALQCRVNDLFGDMPTEHHLVQRALLEGVVVRNHAVSWRNGNERYELLLDSNVLRDKQGEIVGAYVLFKDVSNLRSLEEQVQRSDRLAMIGQIAAGTAHEIRNPLTSIKGFLQVFKKTLHEKGMEKEVHYTEIMLTEINRINELVGEFLLLSKPKHVTIERVDLYQVMNDIMPIIRSEAVLHGVHVRYAADEALPYVVADRELLKQVFINIAKNGIEAIVDGGTLTITVRRDDASKRVLIDIHDTGPGIPSFLIDKIFDPFFTTKQNGTGLGLSVCQRIIHDLGGTIRVASKGFGTTFTLSVPFQPVG
ncbi:ATP-binding protein [Paenibacillus apiarius]|uniref:histidine kinase n=1 Tax=Paenibacillus apiarius TaxID=46240 RepID=A0ABT4DZQ6_9BACL|nr:ATP-binding protein [Paenibacillus apiarius]MBN3524444.1 PAS domain-containing protein [Paenibacillus apiarius]MCY9516624.1 ATP-binding protein [Paenibacillus apiarius]MCY9522839.1 ATP-binding protein [Paenibacillus apiarius]MCY9550543.1 ATP-binding protein [Paenibacillus apiarius]MCY9560812.1 ATP-binding protein [Paenibacillus apiarius]